VVVVVLLGTLAISPTARAQAQQLFARFVAVDSPEAFMAEQISKQRAEREAAQSGVTPAGDTSDTAAAGKGEVVQGSEGENSVTPAEPTQDTDRPSYLDQKQPFPGIVDDWRPDAPLASIPDDVVLPTHPRGNSLAASNLASLEEAQSKVSFTIHTPTWLPDGYSLQGVMVPPDLSNTLNLPARPANAPQLPAPTLATLNFSNGTDTFILSQVQRPQVEGGPAREMLLPIPNDRGSVQEITIKGQSAQYIEMGSARQVHWQDANGVMYDLISNTLDQATLIRIAESVQ
jgi:hypothetical protein